ncbi:MAG TPA: dihydropteroate synthase [Bacteroidia bacterium]|nr:dihydropteroate synthase [Bacteroidia bacterium]
MANSHSINIKGNLFSLNKPLVMGILNVNNDSFYKKSRFTAQESVLKHIDKMQQDGAAIIDIGAASTRSGAKLVSASDEIEVLLPIIKLVMNEFPHLPFSIDTYNAQTANVMVHEGASLINDISAGKYDPLMFKTIADLGIPYIMMHIQGIPETMQLAPTYQHVVKDTIEYFVERVGCAREAGIKDVIIDPGFGFGKTLEHNYSLLKSLSLFKVFDCPILCGLSRKSVINKVINTDAENALNGTTVLNTIALLNGANILRVHDVLEAKQAVELFYYYSNVN